MNKHGIAVYTDGGCRDGRGGWGIHGFLFSYEDDIKPTTVDTTYYATDKGYVNKSLYNQIFEKQIKVEELPSELADNPIISKVQILHYFEGFGSFNRVATNNIAELEAAISGLLYAYDYDVRKVVLISDSNYVIKGITEWYEKWIVQNWIKRDGTPVPNTPEWKRLVDARNQLVNRGVQLEFRRIDGHNGHIGNEIADRFATLGVNYSIHNEYINQLDKCIPVDEYWKVDVDHHPFICTGRMYFNTMEDGRETQYCLSNITQKADETFGAKISEAAYSIVELEKPDPILNTIIEHSRNIADGDDAIIYVRLDEAYSYQNYVFLKNHGKRALLQKSQYSYGLAGLDDNPITDEFNPPRLAHRAVSICTQLSDVLASFDSKDPNFKITDITNKLYAYETVITKKESKAVCKLNKEFTSGVTHFDVDVQSGLREELVQIRLTFNIDVPNRNALKRIEEMNPSVFIITWRESNNSFRYATIITTEVGARGIFCGYFSNLRVL